MGVPKFYRWISERYPCLSEVVKEYQIPEFDNLYLDMNGVIHTCSHPNDDDPHFRITEEKIFSDIFHYLEVLFRMIQPRKVFFMAIDGVAPRAKMNQQRGRRFRSAREAELNEKKARDRGESLPKEDRFDSNCITPGTPFMVRLQEQLKYFVVNKISTDTLWRNTKVILSGHETPGEGEHKIMDFIRHEKSQPGYDPNTRHCLYGLDADLIMLGLCSHDPHFSLLREEVKFGAKKSQASKRTPTPEETTFHLLHLSLLREYLDYEFQELKCLSFYNLENIIDDWVMMGFLVGNDFIPHLPNMHINKGALPELFGTYKKVLPVIGGYINEGGHLNLPRFEKFMQTLAEYELEKFDDIYSDAKWLEGKTARKTNGRTEVEATPGPGHAHEMLEGQPEPGVNPVKPSKRNADLQKLMESTNEFETSESETDPDPLDCEDSSRSGFYQMEFRQHKRDYYIHKLGYKQVTEETLREQAEGYVRAIQWNLHYYYNGCISWSWFYPHHFSPWITDIKGFSDMEMKFELSKPFLPFEQLMAVLPAASKNLVPKALQWLMTSSESEIIDYYPPDFEQDLNGKQQDWEAVVLIPFIDEQRLLAAMKPIYDKLSSEETNRNKHGPMYVSHFTPERKDRYPAPAYFPAVEPNHCTMDLVPRQDWDVPINKLKKGLMEGVKLGVFFPGFPTLQHISHTAKLVKSQVKVFEQTSRGENMVLTLENQGRPDILEVAKAMIGKEVWVAWPHLIEAKVVAVSNSQRLLRTADEQEDPLKDFKIQTTEMKNKYASRFGIDIGNTEIIIHACAMSGRRYEMAAKRGRITLEKQWHNSAQLYPLQIVVADIPVHDPSCKAYCTVEELFQPGTSCFMLGDPGYGALSTVIKIDPAHHGRIQIKSIAEEEPNFSAVFAKQNEVQDTYQTAYRAAQHLGISSHVLSRVTGTIFLIRGSRHQQMDSVSKTNIGLNLKFNKRNEEVAGYTKKQENGWTYSKACVNLLLEYQRKFPEVFQYMASSSNSNTDMFHELDVFPDEEDVEERVKELITWLENVPTHSAARQPFGTETVDEEIVKLIEKCSSVKRPGKEILMQVKPRLLYLPNQYAGSSLVDPNTVFKLFDRVVNIREGFSVPLGLHGTLIRIQKGSKPAENLYDVVFDSEFTGGLTLNCSSGKGYRLPGSALLNISFKEKTQWVREDQRRAKPWAAVEPYFESGQQSGTVGRNNRQNNRPRYDDRSRGANNRNRWEEKNPQFGDRPARNAPNPLYNDEEMEAAKSFVKPEPPSLVEDSSTVFPRKKNDEDSQVLPPDPSTIPLPQGFIQNKQRREECSESGKGRGKAPKQDIMPPQKRAPQQHQQLHMQNLWQSLEQTSDSLPIAAQPGGLAFRQDICGTRGVHTARDSRQAAGHQLGHCEGSQFQPVQGHSTSGRRQDARATPDQFEDAQGASENCYSQEVKETRGEKKGRGRGKSWNSRDETRSISEMEQNIKQMLNISAKKNPLLDTTGDSETSSTGYSDICHSSKYTNILRSLSKKGSAPPRYRVIPDTRTGLLTGEVILGDGTTFTSTHLMDTNEGAYDSAAKAAVTSIQGDQRAEYPQPLASTEADRTPFVPLQVAKKAAQSKERDERSQTRSSHSPSVELQAVDANITGKQSSARARGVKGTEKKERRGRGGQRKMKLAANFGNKAE